MLRDLLYHFAKWRAWRHDYWGGWWKDVAEWVKSPMSWRTIRNR